MQLEAIEKISLVEVVEQKILNLVRKNNLSIGDSLPAELELTEGLGVSRSVVREALSRLRMLGLLESRKKRGIVIAEPDVFGEATTAPLSTAVWSVRKVEMSLSSGP